MLRLTRKVLLEEKGSPSTSKKGSQYYLRKKSSNRETPGEEGGGSKTAGCVQSLSGEGASESGISNWKRFSAKGSKSQNH